VAPSSNSSTPTSESLRPDRVHRGEHHVLVRPPVAGEVVVSHGVEVIAVGRIASGERRHEIEQQRVPGAVEIRDVCGGQFLPAGHDAIVLANMSKHREQRPARAVELSCEYVGRLHRVIGTLLPFAQEISDLLVRAVDLILIHIGMLMCWAAILSSFLGMPSGSTPVPDA